MKRLSLGEVREQLRLSWVRLKGQRFFSDRLSLSILIPTVVINVANLILLAVKLEPTDFAVPVRYSSLVGFDTLGPWYHLYGIGLFGLMVTLTNGSLAAVSYARSRITSFFLLIGAFVVALFCLIISLAFTAIV